MILLLTLLFSFQAHANDVVIGFVGGLTSEMAREARQAQAAMTIAIDEQNKKGDIIRGSKVRLEVFDTHNDPLYSKSIVRDLKRRGVNAVVGLIGGEDDIILANYLEKARIPTVAEASTIPDLVKDKQFIVQTCIDHREQARALANKLISIGKKRLIIVVNNTVNFNVQFAEYFVEYFKSVGGEIVARQSMNMRMGATRRLASEVFKDEHKADIILLDGTTIDSLSVWVELKKLGTSIDYASVDSIEYIEPDSFLKNLKDDFNIRIFNGFFNLNKLNKDGKVFYSKFNSRFPELAINSHSFDAVFTYDSTQILLKAIHQAGATDSELIMNALKSVHIEGVTGPLSYKPDGRTTRHVVFLSFRKGKIEDAE